MLPWRDDARLQKLLRALSQMYLLFVYSICSRENMVTMTEQLASGPICQQQENEEFLNRWKGLEEAINDDISQLAGEGRTSSEDKSYLKERFEKIVSALFDMDRMLSKAAATLPPFVLRKLTIAIKQLRTRALQVRSEVLPRQPFAFSSKDAIVLATDPMSQGIRIVGGEAEVPVEAPGGELHVDEDEIMGKLANLTGETRTLDSTELQDRAWMVSDLKDCTIRMLGTIPTLFLHRLSNCNIIAGPVSGATFGEDMQDCSLQLATHQLRLHSSTNVLVHVRAASSPIIEHCTSVGFGALTQPLYSDFEAACAMVQLPDSEHWKGVQDFLHPGSTQTANWHMIK